jgi:hypothetical protein
LDVIVVALPRGGVNEIVAPPPKFDPEIVICVAGLPTGTEFGATEVTEGAAPLTYMVAERLETPFTVPTTN